MLRAEQRGRLLKADPIALLVKVIEKELEEVRQKEVSSMVLTSTSTQTFR